jgi:ATP-binding cassette subfamily B protein/subfamily B ATP-binding cassette protein MsbA
MFLEGGASIGQITGLMGYTGMLMGPIYMIVQTFGELQKSLAAVDRVFDHLREPDEVDDPPDAVEAPALVRDIRFENVSFAYNQDKPVIHDFSLDVPRGASVALVGPSGAGKTTIADLVARFYEPSSGTILLNGVPFGRIRLHSYRRLLGFVAQEIFLFDGSVAENLAYGREEATRDEIIAAAVQANAHDFIMELPDGYDTMIGERGAILSGGQRQRLSIARAIVADPQILILDEATSALDSESERLIQEALERLEANRTTFVIAHRLSTIARSDIIVVLDKGRMVECGHHRELMALRGRYWHMVEQQRGAFDTAGATV